MLMYYLMSFFEKENIILRFGIFETEIPIEQ